MIATSVPAGNRAALPSVDRLLGSSAGTLLVARHGHPLVVETLRALLAEQRALLAAAPAAIAVDASALLDQCGARIETLMRPSLRPVFNLSGTVLHTNLGRALYPQAAIDAEIRRAHV